MGLRGQRTVSNCSRIYRHCSRIDGPGGFLALALEITSDYVHVIKYTGNRKQTYRETTPTPTPRMVWYGKGGGGVGDR